jgi:hypothetical protein
MVNFNDIHTQLMRSKSQIKFVGVEEVRKLSRIIEPEEQIMALIKGWHSGALTIMCATDRRIILLPMSRTTEHHEVSYADITTVARHEKPVGMQLVLETSTMVYVLRTWHKKYLVDMHQFIERHALYIHEQLGAQRKELYELPVQLSNISKNLRMIQKMQGLASGE